MKLKAVWADGACGCVLAVASNCLHLLPPVQRAKQSRSSQRNDNIANWLDHVQVNEVVWNLPPTNTAGSRLAQSFHVRNSNDRWSIHDGVQRDSFVVDGWSLNLES